MRIIVVLCLFLCGFVKPVPKVTVPEPCFAPARLHITVAELQKSSCKTPPVETLLDVYRVEPDSLVCGFHQEHKTRGNLEFVITINVTKRDLSGTTIVFYPDCWALYETTYLKI